jgi:hypothetical protein
MPRSLGSWKTGWLSVHSGSRFWEIGSLTGGERADAQIARSS